MRERPNWAGFIAAATIVSVQTMGASANERHFTYTYESATLPEGSVEFEPWTTWRVGRERYYNRLDHRLELELGLTDHLMTALYLNFGAITAADDMGGRQTEFSYQGVSSEWKLRALDSVADPIGLAFYIELTGATDEVEFEQKVIVDRRWDSVLFAANVVGEQEIEIGVDESEVELIFELDLALGYEVAEHWMVGLELRNQTSIFEGEFEHSVFFAGPTVSYATEGYWLALSVQPQIFSIDGEEEVDPTTGMPAPDDGDIRDILDHEMFNTRLLVGIHI